jgi:hypothetical protein
MFRAFLAGALLFAAPGLAQPVTDGDAQRRRDPAVTREFQRSHPCPATGMPAGPCPGWVKDHVIPLCKGGPDSVGNMQWQMIEDAKAKDRWECR